MRNDDLVDTDTEIEHDTVHDAENMENKINQKITDLIAETNKMMKFLMKKLIMMLLKRQIYNLETILILILIWNIILFMMLKR